MAFLKKILMYNPCDVTVDYLAQLKVGHFPEIRTSTANGAIGKIFIEFYKYITISKSISYHRETLQNLHNLFP